MTTLHVCGDCAGRLFEMGGKLDETVTSLSLGMICETHPTELDRTATNAVRAPEGWKEGTRFPAPAKPTLPEMQAPTSARSDGRAELGPVTEIATRLLASWSGASEGAAASVQVRHAVDIARELLAETGGA